MEATLYLDVVLAVNAAADFLLLTALKGLLRKQVRPLRLLASALIGACLGTGELLWRLFFLLPLEELCWERLPEGFAKAMSAAFFILSAAGFALAGGTVMLLAAFGWCGLRGLANRQALLFALAALSEGVLELGWGEELFAAPSLLVLLSGSLFLADSLLKIAEEAVYVKQRCCMVRLSFRGQSMLVWALLDTGNMLKDPVTGRPVHVADPGLLKRLCPSVEGVTLIPYRTIEGEDGLLTAVTLDHMEILKKRGLEWRAERTYEKPLVAAGPRPFAKAQYGLILHP